MLVISSVSPVFLTYAFILWIENKSSKKIIIILLIVAIFVVISHFILSLSTKKLERLRFPITSIKTADANIFAFFIAYLFPFISLSSDKINELVLVFILLLFVFMILGTHSYHTNPILTFLGYHFYEVTTPENITYLLITKRDLRNTKQIDYIVQISDYMVLDTKNKGEK